MSYVVNGAFRTQSLLHGLLEYWQVNETEQRTASTNIDTTVALNKALDNLEIMRRESGAIITSRHLPTMDVNEIAQNQNFQNLISNAIKYSKPGHVPEIEVSAARAPDAVWQFSIKDNGIGIASEHHDLLFKLFKRLHGNRYAGTGLGLALSAKIIENLGGTIWVESEPDVGSTFCFTVPERNG